MAGVGHLKRIFKDAFRVAGAVQKTCSSEMLGGQGADFLRGVAFWSIRSSGLLRSLFRGRRSTFDRWTGKIAKRIGTRLSALHSTFHFLMKSLRSVSFLMLSTSKIEIIRTSRRTSSLLMLSTSIFEEVSQNCCVFDVV